MQRERRHRAASLPLAGRADRTDWLRCHLDAKLIEQYRAVSTQVADAMGLGPFASRYRCKCDGTGPTSAAIPSVLSISPMRERLEMCRRGEEIWGYRVLAHRPALKSSSSTEDRPHYDSSAPRISANNGQHLAGDIAGARGRSEKHESRSNFLRLRRSLHRRVRSKFGNFVGRFVGRV